MKSFIRIPLLNLLTATLLGAFLRSFAVVNYPVNYKFFLHAHSHVAFLGWAYLAFFLAIVHEYIPSSGRSVKYKIQLWATQLTVLGMLVTFPIQGYALYSIIFSTLQIVLSYYFFYSVLRDVPREKKSSLSFKFIFAALFFMTLSSLGPFALGFILSKGLAGSPWYNLSIYFYLHFQYNGWFAFMVIGLLLKILENRQLVLPPSIGKKVFPSFVVSTLLGYLLSTLWVNPPFPVYILSFCSASLQLVAVWYLIQGTRSAMATLWNTYNKWTKALCMVSLTCFVLKCVLQFFSVFIPIFEIRPLIIAFLHLTLIGFISLSLFFYWYSNGLLDSNRLLKAGFAAVLSGFVLSEGILFLNSGMLWLRIGSLPSYSEILLWTSLLMPLGFLCITISQFINSKKLR